MIPVHPFVVHLPIALVFLWPVVDLVGVWRAKRDLSHAGAVFLVLAMLSSLAATVTGQASYDDAVLRGFDPHVLNGHRDNANLVPWMLLVLVAFRMLGPIKFGKTGHACAIALGLLVWPFVVIVGRSGGAMVFEHGVGVERIDRR